MRDGKKREDEIEGVYSSVGGLNVEAGVEEGVNSFAGATKEETKSVLESVEQTVIVDAREEKK